MARKKDMLAERAQQINARLTQRYPDACCALHHANPLQLLVATMLSAQCTDVCVNKVTPALFARYPDAQAYAGAKLRELQALIKPTGFFRNKARNIRACCQALVEHHSGQVPRTMAELVHLPGIGRKTANVILGNAFEVPGIPVDTHVGRLARRMGLTGHENPEKVEAVLMQLLPDNEWTMFGHRMIAHGRQTCHSRKPKCSVCVVQDLCPMTGVTVSG